MVLRIYENYLINQFSDKIIPTPSGAETIEESDIWRHLVFLRSNNEVIGVVGLLQYVKPGSGPQGIFNGGKPEGSKPEGSKPEVNYFQLN